VFHNLQKGVCVVVSDSPVPLTKIDTACKSNISQNGEWTEISTRHVWRVTFFFELSKNLQQIPNKQYSNVQQFILQILTSH
jgi:hypothetical protein